MSEDGRDNADNPGVIAPPPLIYAGALLSGLLANRRYHIPFLPRPLMRILGWPLVAGGFAVGLLGYREMRRAETNLDPRKPATTLVTEGPFRFTRNPLYLSMTLLYGGISALANALPALLLLPIVLHLMRRGVIEREERYLERKFGDVYLLYKVKAPRWI
ncbi:MAG: isoprenylcysteine carboxylmethyltransferase family protein [Rubrobacteraceae bacterium]|nr:isoprenylcysteine carboxylmethyltransferase family protein [Rubrobacteraceae bacterium]MBA3585606.1 isoprenylcysteine carboxylmethyltransferase family protein [Gemmatimonadota bacterium]MBA3637382.1 isoprenylcysteine carboxylmethyltransferase family protein [Rubrobacteraceae bacterium]MDQ3304211.1 isoprenylcysteine carboxylmethyltransferase family protein [Actinomycetota bacterium]